MHARRDEKHNLALLNHVTTTLLDLFLPSLGYLLYRRTENFSFKHENLLTDYAPGLKILPKECTRQAY